ncbi:hypothetical protein GE09DRAFT_1052845 [Coniochaeta sp. 2T2.1]|nr:hypothetical protein GE09DRAFT_1052845 [Coniochaeta sp. 2T2.1]
MPVYDVVLYKFHDDTALLRNSICTIAPTATHCKQQEPTANHYTSAPSFISHTPPLPQPMDPSDKTAEQSTPGPSEHPTTSNSVIPDTPSTLGKGPCHICSKTLLLKNMKRHFQGQHKEVYDMNLSVQEMFDKAAAELSAAAGPSNDAGPSNTAGPSTPAKSNAPAGPPRTNREKKLTCPLCKCQILRANMRRHVKNTHPGIWGEGETLQEMFDKATPFPDLDADPMDLDAEEEEDEQVELALSDDEGEYEGESEGYDDDDDYDEGETIDQPNHGGTGVEKVRQGWMSFGPA